MSCPCCCEDINLGDFLDSKYERHDHTHDGEFESCTCENIIQDICPFSEECSGEIYEEGLIPYSLYTRLEQVTFSSMPETMLIYTHPSGGTIHHGPMVTSLLKRKHACTPVNYPYGTLDLGMDCYFTIGNYSMKYINEVCKKIGDITKKRKHAVLFQVVSDIGDSDQEEYKFFYTQVLFTMMYRVLRGESIYIQGDDTKSQAILYIVLGLLSLDSRLVLNLADVDRHLHLVYGKHGKKYSSINKKYLQHGILTNIRLLRTAYHIIEVHSQTILPDSIPEFPELPLLIAPSPEAITYVLSRFRVEQTNDYIRLLFSRDKNRIHLSYQQIFRSELIRISLSKSGLYSVD